MTPIQEKILQTAIILFSVFIFRFLLLRLTEKKAHKAKQRFAWRQTISVVLLIITIPALVFLWSPWAKSLATLFSIVAAASVVVSKELILNVVAYGVIIWRALFDAGDRIEIEDIRGDVTAIGPIYTTLAEVGHASKGADHTGRVVKIPNSMFLTKPVKNATLASEIIWDAIQLELQQDSDWRKAQNMLGEILKTHSYQLTKKDITAIKRSDEEIMFLKTDPEISLRMVDNKIIIRGRFICRADRRLNIENKIWADILDQIRPEKNIEFEKSGS